MSINVPQFPGQVWDGSSPTRTSRDLDFPPTYEDWDQVVAEMIATQEYCVALNAVDNHSTLIGNNASAIAVNASGISANSDSISTNASNIAANASAAAANASIIAANTSNLGDAVTAIAAAEANIASNVSRIDALEAYVLTIGDEVDSAAAEGVLYVNNDGNLAQKAGFKYNESSNRLEVAGNFLAYDSASASNVFIRGEGGQGTVIITSAEGYLSFLRLQGHNSAADIVYLDQAEEIQLGWSTVRCNQRGFEVQKGTGDPNTQGASVAIYAKEVNGVTKLFAKNSDGSVSQLS